SANEYTGVIRATRDLISDVRKVTGDTPSLYTDSLPASRHIILVGTLGKNAWIDSLVRWNRIDIRRLKDHWETYLISTIPHPFPGVDEALVIAGSDKRGTIYGLYDISSQIGVSPWYWWADVPVISHKNVYILPGEHTIG